MAKASRHCLSNKVNDLSTELRSLFSPDDFRIFVKVSSDACIKRYRLIKDKLKDKFEKLFAEKFPPTTRTRPSTLRDPILQLQTQPLTPEEVDVLNLGPKFVLTPKKIPTMDIVHEVERAAFSLELAGNRAGAEDLRRQTVNILLRAKPPPL